MDFKPAVPNVSPAQAIVDSLPPPPPADGKTIIIGVPSKSVPPHVQSHVVASAQPVKKQYMWQLRRARGEKF